MVHWSVILYQLSSPPFFFLFLIDFSNYSSIVTMYSGKWYILIIFWLLHSWILQFSWICINPGDVLRFNISIHHHLFLYFSISDTPSVSSSEKCIPRIGFSSLPTTEKISTEKMKFCKNFSSYLIVFPVCWNLWPYFSCSSLDVSNNCVITCLLFIYQVRTAIIS